MLRQGDGLLMAPMAPRRLRQSRSRIWSERYKAGENSAALAEAFGCSTNTVSRTVNAVVA